MSSKSDSFEFPSIYNFPPFFTIQPVENTKRQQIQLWCNLVLEYCKYHKIFDLEIVEASNSPLFYNKSINRRLSPSAIKLIFEELVHLGNGKWTGKDSKALSIIWRTAEKWAELIYDYVTRESLLNTVCSQYELRESDEVQSEEFYNLDINVFKAAIQVLEKKKLCTVFSGSIADSWSVKFFAPSM